MSPALDEVYEGAVHVLQSRYFRGSGLSLERRGGLSLTCSGCPFAATMKSKNDTMPPFDVLVSSVDGISLLQGEGAPWTQATVAELRGRGSQHFPTPLDSDRCPYDLSAGCAVLCSLAVSLLIKTCCLSNQIGFNLDE